MEEDGLFTLVNVPPPSNIYPPHHVIIGLNKNSRNCTTTVVEANQTIKIRNTENHRTRHRVFRTKEEKKKDNTTLLEVAH